MYSLRGDSGRGEYVGTRSEIGIPWKGGSISGNGFREKDFSESSAVLLMSHPSPSGTTGEEKERRVRSWKEERLETRIFVLRRLYRWHEKNSPPNYIHPLQARPGFQGLEIQAWLHEPQHPHSASFPCRLSQLLIIFCSMNVCFDQFTNKRFTTNLFILITRVSNEFGWLNNGIQQWIGSLR